MNSPAQRTPVNCQYRKLDTQLGAAHCGLLDDVLRAESSAAPQVNNEICTACCCSFEPTLQDLNFVVASLLWSTADAAIRQAEFTDKECSQWQSLRAWAEGFLPVVLPEEAEIAAAACSDLTTIPFASLEEVQHLLPSPAVRSGIVRDWAVAITTAPRRQETLSGCIRSLAAAGWTAPHLFIDGLVNISEEFHLLPRTLQEPAVGARHSYLLALAELLERHPTADVLMIVQDDCLWPERLPVRAYLEQALWPGAQPGLVSAWCSADDTAAVSGWHRYPGTWRFGAVTFLYPRPLAEQFVNDPQIQDACRSPGANSGGLSKLIGDWATNNDIAVYFPTPSLVQHVGEISTIWGHARAVGVRRAARFLGDEWAEQQTHS